MGFIKKKYLPIFLIISFFLFLKSTDVFANACDSNATGNWDTAGTWTNCGGTTPQSADTVTIKNTHVVTIDGTTHTVSALTIQSGGTLSQGNTSLQTVTNGLTIDSGGVLTHAANTDTAAPWVANAVVNIQAATMSIAGSINVAGLGYLGATATDGNGYGPGGGPGSNVGGSGGGHGGDGGVGGSTSLSGSSGGVGNDLMKSPSDLGSGGGATRGSDAGNGGGAVKLTVTSAAAGALAISGSITTAGGVGTINGGAQYGGAGGAGGSIYINMSGGGTITGTGTLSVAGADGADGSSYDGGGGGGGRIAIVGYSSLSSLTYTLTGGTDYATLANEGGAGTLVTQASGTNGTLLLANAGVANYTKSTMDTAESTVTFAAIHVRNGAYFVMPSGETINLEASSFTTPSVGVGKFQVAGTFNVNSSGDSFSVPMNMYLLIKTGAVFQSYDGSPTNVDLTLDTDGDAYGSGNEDGTLEMVDYTTASLTLNSLTVNGKVTHEANDAGNSLTDKVKISAGSVTISSTGIMDVTGAGYLGPTASTVAGAGPGPGAASSNGAGGGGHKGAGGNSNFGVLGGGAYDTAAAPTDHGSSGGSASTSDGGGGGGTIEVIITNGGTFSHSGSITSVGIQPALTVSTYGGGGGAGGSVYIHYPSGGTFTGTSGSISVAGGGGADGSSRDGGGGSAGFIAIIGYTTNSTSGFTTVLTGGTAAGAATAGANGTYTATAAGNLTSTNVEPATLNGSATGTATISFTTTTAIPITGKIKITFGSGFNVASASGATCSSMDGSFATSVSGQVVTITRSAGTSETPAAETCTVANITNPSAAGSTGTYKIVTTNSTDDIIDGDLAVAADTIVASSRRRIMVVGQKGLFNKDGHVADVSKFFELSF